MAGLRQRRLGTVPYIAVDPFGHRLADAEAVTLEDLAGEISGNDGQPVRRADEARREAGSEKMTLVGAIRMTTRTALGPSKVYGSPL
ncbi:MAG: hypothetical protein JWQ81_4568 [Amycolatopsis sp.]|jgi:hypothetical protein|nr:hypothetical protein [Amycolatopsis sp.]